MPAVAGYLQVENCSPVPCGGGAKRGACPCPDSILCAQHRPLPGGTFVEILKGAKSQSYVAQIFQLTSPQLRHLEYASSTH